jgi:hypothetical protein
MRQPFDVIVIALGGNDGLRGIAPAVSRTNLQGIIDRVRAKYPVAKILLAGMQMPPQLGADYARDFAAIYPVWRRKITSRSCRSCSKASAAASRLNQGDRIHPNAGGPRRHCGKRLESYSTSAYPMRFTRLPAPPLARFTRPARVGVVATALLAGVGVAQAEPGKLPITLRAEGSASWAENISRSSASTDWRDTARHNGEVTASMLTPLATGVSLISEVAAGYESVPRYVLNTEYSATARAQLRWKFGLGAYTPVVTLSTSLSRREARIDAADGWRATGALRISKRFTESWRASVTGDWEQVYASHTTFDVRHHRLLGTLTYDLNDRWQLTYGRGSLWGDFVANASARVWNRALTGQLSPAIGAYYPTLSWEVTNSYGPAWVSYRAKGRADFGGSSSPPPSVAIPRCLSATKALIRRTSWGYTTGRTCGP